jgi:small subunit ribosomal protein S6
MPAVTSEGRFETVRKYEAVYIMDAALPEEEQTALTERLQRVLTEQGGTVDAVDKWERRRLAYEVKGKREGNYVVLTFSGQPAVAAELDRVMGLADSVLRHLVVAVEEKKTSPRRAAARQTEPEVVLTS